MPLLALLLSLAACSSDEHDTGAGPAGTDGGATTSDGGTDGGSTTWTTGGVGDLVLRLDDAELEACAELCGFVGLTAWSEAGPFEIELTLRSDLDGPLAVEVDPYYGADDTRFCVAQELTVGEHRLTASADGFEDTEPVAVVITPCG